MAAKAKVPKPIWVRDAEVVRVIDGDTIEAKLTLGYYVAITIKIRLRGINAPEKNTAEGKKVMAYVQQLLPAGTPIVVETYHKPEDPRDRWVGKVFKGDMNLSDHLLAKKMAVPFMVDA